MQLKLFDNEETNKVDVFKIEIDKEFARRYEHNKKREALQRYEELKKKGQIENSNSESDSESSDEEDEAELNRLSKKEDIKKLFENLIKVKKHNPSVYQNVNLFESESESDDDGKVESKGSKKKAKYLKDVMAQHLIEEGPELEDAESSKLEKVKTYNEEQEGLKKAFLDEVKNLDENDDAGDLLKVKEKKNETESDDNGEFDEYFGPDGALDENSKFLKDFFKNQMWVDRENKDGRSFDEDEVDDLLKDDEEIERQEKYEESYNFRYEENTGDRVMGHSRIVEGSVRKKENSRKEQRKNKMERLKIAEMERKEELKHLKNLKKKEMKERLMKVMEVAGVTDGNDFALDLDDLEEDFDPAEYDKMMKAAFGEKYYNADDVDPEFGSDKAGDGDIEKPDFDKEDELLGLSKGWDAVKNGDGFLAARKKVLEKMAKSDDDEDEEEEEERAGADGGDDNDDDDKEEEEKEESGGADGGDDNDDDDKEEEEKRAEENLEIEQKRKRKRKISLVQRAKEAMLEEYYKLDYEDTIGDLKTRFKYAKVKPNRFGLKTEEILMLDDKELNQFVSVKKIVPFREKEWKVPNNKRYEYKMKVRELLHGKSNHGKTSKKKSSRENGDKPASHQHGKPELEETNVEMGNLSRRAKRKRRQAELKLSKSRMAAYLNIQPKPKAKRKHRD